MREITIICWDGHSQEEKENRSVNLKRPTGFLRPAPEQRSTAGNFWKMTGLFDEEHFAYLEDTDIGYRARLLGYENWYEPSAKVTTSEAERAAPGITSLKSVILPGTIFI